MLRATTYAAIYQFVDCHRSPHTTKPQQQAEHCKYKDDRTDKVDLRIGFSSFKHVASTDTNMRQPHVSLWRVLPRKRAFFFPSSTFHDAILGRRLASSEAIPSRGARGSVPRTTTPKPKRNLLLQAGLPFVFFSILASWVVSESLRGKLKEMEVSQGRKSQSLRQAMLEKEKEDIMEKISVITAKDFDNTKRIKRPHEILEERRRERQRRNAWHRRLYRYFAGSQD